MLLPILVKGGMDMFRLRRLLIVITMFGFGTCPLWAQQSVSTDAQTAALMQQSITNQTGGVQITDVTLNGTVTFFDTASQESGTITLTATANGQSQVVLQLPSGRRSETRLLSSSGVSTGTRIGTDGVAYNLPAYNVMIYPTWFFPVFVMNASMSSSTFVASNMGPESRDGATAYHIAVWQQQAGDSPNTAFARKHLSSEDIYLDTTSLLPVALAYNTHPESGSAADIPIEIRFSSYQHMQGKTYPTHLQIYIMQTLAYDVEISTVTFNSGTTIQPGS